MLAPGMLAQRGLGRGPGDRVLVPRVAVRSAQWCGARRPRDVRAAVLPGAGPGRSGRGPPAATGLTLPLRSGRRFRPWSDVGAAVAQYCARVVPDEVRRIVPIVAVAVAVVAALVDPSTPGELLL